MKTKLVLIVVMSLLTMGSFFDGFACHTTINGTVSDQYSNILSSATITIEASDLFAYSKNDGFYNLKKITRGEHTVKAKKKGYVDKTKTIDAPFFGATIEENFELAIAVDGLEPNDDIANAYNVDDLLIWEYGIISQQLCWTTTITSVTIHSSDDEDWYEVYVSSSERLYMSVGNISVGCNYDIEFWTLDNLLMGSYSLSNVSDSIQYWAIPANSYYYIRVFSASGYDVTNEYTLIVERFDD